MIQHLSRSITVCFCFLAAALSGCASSSLDRSAVSRLQRVEIVQVVTPALEVPTFMQAAVKGGALGGAAPALIAQGEKKTTLTPPLISDFGALLAERLKRRLASQAAWTPATTLHRGAVPANYVHADGAWLRVEVHNYEVAAGFGRLLIGVKVSLLNPRNEGAPLWETREAYSGLVHGGEKIAMEKLPGDASQLNHELERAADWFAQALTKNIR